MIHYMSARTMNGWVGVAMVLFLLGMSVGAQETVFRVTEKRIGFHGIDVYVSENGAATVEERFFFNFLAGEAAQFEKDFVENTPSLSSWKEDYSFVSPHIGSEGQVKNVEFLLNRTSSGEPTLTMSYAYPNGLVQQMNVDSQGRSTRWKISEIALVDFIESANIRIPANTQIKFHFPSSSVIDTTLLPQGVSASNGVVTLTNIQTNALRIEYLLFTPIADPIDLGKIVQDFQQSPLFVLFIAAIAIIGVYVALNREMFSKKIEEYVIEHSEFKTKPKQDIDADLGADEA